MLSISQIPILSIVEVLGIEHRFPVAGTIDCKCPFCNSKGYKLHVELTEGVFRCNRCGTNGGKLGLYTLVRYGKPYSRDMRNAVLPELVSDLALTDDSVKESRYRVYDKPAYVTPYTELPDEVMHSRISGIFSLPLLELSAGDREKLLKRGFTKLEICNLEYRSVEYERIQSQIPSWMKKRCYSENWREKKNRNEILKKVSMNQFLCFLTLGNQAKSRGIDLRGVPGAFSLSTPSGKLWGLRLYEGVLIPIRNRDGLIVAAQVRTEHADRKYMLLSSRGLPDGTTGKSRIHYPLANHGGMRKESATMMLTEGPLKADVYCCLAEQHPHQAMALLGVNSTADLKSELLSNPGIRTVYECFDADKLVNLSVMSGVRKIKESIRATEKTVISVFWDREYAEHTLQEYRKYAHENHVTIPELAGSCFQQLGQLAILLHNAGVTVPKELTHWAGETKGIDDYLYSLKNS